MKKRTAALAGFVGAALLLTGCASSDKALFGDKVTARVVPLPDGGEVICVTYNKAGGVSCDWEGASK